MLDTVLSDGWYYVTLLCVRLLEISSLHLSGK
jgi:hypothetical protein